MATACGRRARHLTALRRSLEQLITRGDGGPVLAGGPVILRRFGQQDLQIEIFFRGFTYFTNPDLKFGSV
jgi:hypothetical protein